MLTDMFILEFLSLCILVLVAIPRSPDPEQKNIIIYLFVRMKYYLVLPDILWILKYNINMIIIKIMIIINTSIITLTLVAIMRVELPSALVDVLIGRPVELVTK